MPRPALAVACLPLLSLVGCGGSSPVVIPKSFSDFNSPDGVFAVQYPKGWEVESNVGKTISWAKFRSGGAEIRVNTDVKASLLDDAGGGRAADRAAPSPELAPVHGIHEMGLDGAPKEYGGYEETPAGTQELDCPLGPARFSEFTANATFGGSLHGYRATVIGSKKGIHVVCVGPESDWPKLRRVYDRVLKSLKRGQVE